MVYGPWAPIYPRYPCLMMLKAIGPAVPNASSSLLILSAAKDANSFLTARSNVRRSTGLNATNLHAVKKVSRNQRKSNDFILLVFCYTF